MKTSTYKPTTKTGGDYAPTTAHKRGSSADTSTVATITLSRMTSAILISVETTNARVTFDGSDPSLASAPSNVYPKDVTPALVPVGPDATVKFCSTAGTASVVQICELS